ncbi:MAG: hypothetical protein ACRDXX_08045 [Stackebrandtia sp.]
MTMSQPPPVQGAYPPPPPPPQPPPEQPAPAPAPPPQGPGVRVPFAVPPREVNNTKMVLSIVSAIVGVIVVCGGGFLGFTGILMWTTSEMASQAELVAEEFLDDVAAGEYDTAYDSMCPQLQDEMTVEEFAADWDRVGVESYKTDDVVQSAEGDGMEVPADITTVEGDTLEIKLFLVTEQESLNMTVCGW